MRILLGAIALIAFCMVHAIKMMRMYLIIMDQKVSFDRYVPAYLRTTLVNLIVPYKLGEIYRIGVFYRISGGFKTGFFSVLIDRFFDTLALVMILLPYQMFISRNITTPTVLLTVFEVVVLLAYRIFPPSYDFLNRYIITSKESKRSMMALSVLDEYARGLVRGRYGILMLFSLAAWLLEIAVLAIFNRLWGYGFGVSDFGAYIESIVSSSDYATRKAYTAASVVVIAVFTVIFTLRYLLAKRKIRDIHK